MSTETDHEWHLGDRVPPVPADFDVWMTDDSVRRVRWAAWFCGGGLHFMDCQHPAQNSICNPERVQAWLLRDTFQEN